MRCFGINKPLVSVCDSIVRNRNYTRSCKIKQYRLHKKNARLHVLQGTTTLKRVIGAHNPNWIHINCQTFLCDLNITDGFKVRIGDKESFLMVKKSTGLE